MEHDLYKEYALLEIEYKSLGEKREKLRTDILKDLISNNKTNVKTDYATFTKSVTQIWEYTPMIKKREDALKVAKMKEQRSGRATLIESDKLIVNLKKI